MSLVVNGDRGGGSGSGAVLDAAQTFTAAQTIAVDGSPSSVDTLLVLRKTTTDAGHGAVGIGGRIRWEAENGAGSSIQIGSIEGSFAGVGTSSELGEIVARTIGGGSSFENWRLSIERTTFGLPVRHWPRTVSQLDFLFTPQPGDTVYVTDASYAGQTGATCTYSSSAWRTPDGAAVHT